MTNLPDDYDSSTMPWAAICFVSLCSLMGLVWIGLLIAHWIS